jgi:preprotein translocase subunit SecA
MLKRTGVIHTVLNAKFHQQEAEIITRAGLRGAVTIATNMAGRGTDIKLGPGVVELGGLHVILTEMHDSSRIDRQLIGRCGRQGDPGTYRQYLSLDDELLMGLGPERADELKEIGEQEGVNFDRYTRLFRLAQRQIEQRHFRDRRILMYHEKERRKMQIQMGQNPYLDTPG